MTVSAHARRRPRRALGIIAAGCVALQFEGSLPWSTVALGCWLGALAGADRASLRRLWLPRFWLITLGIALGSGLLLGERDLAVGSLRVSSAGLTAGALMVVRGAFVFALMGWAGRLATAWDLRGALERIGCGRFGQALAVAFELLPELGERLRRDLGQVRRAPPPGRSRRQLWEQALVELVTHAAAIAESQARASVAASPDAPPTAVARPTIVAIVGPPGSGKTTAVGRVAELLREAGVAVVGVVQPAVHRGNRRVGYRLRDVATGAERLFARRRRHAGAAGFDFADALWTWGRECIVRRRGAPQVLVVDELGRLEAAGEGHLPALLEARAAGVAPVWLVAMRHDCAAAVEQRIGPIHTTFPPDPAKAAACARLLEARLTTSQPEETT